MLEKHRVLIGSALLVGSWAALLAPKYVGIFVFAAAFLVFVLSFRLRNSRPDWGRGLGFQSPAERGLSIGFWVTLLGMGIYRYLLHHDIDIAPTTFAISAIVYLPWPENEHRIETT
ncbi:MAG: hypothetical protein ACKOOL_06400 [Novosphingobium sp.]